MTGAAGVAALLLPASPSTRVSRPHHRSSSQGPLSPQNKKDSSPCLHLALPPFSSVLTHMSPPFLSHSLSPAHHCLPLPWDRRSSRATPIPLQPDLPQSRLSWAQQHQQQRSAVPLSLSLLPGWRGTPGGTKWRDCHHCCCPWMTPFLMHPGWSGGPREAKESSNHSQGWGGMGVEGLCCWVWSRGGAFYLPWGLKMSPSAGPLWIFLVVYTY